jgi:hypothetical protein
MIHFLFVLYSLLVSFSLISRLSSLFHEILYIHFVNSFFITPAVGMWNSQNRKSYPVPRDTFRLFTEFQKKGNWIWFFFCYCN